TEDGRASALPTEHGALSWSADQPAHLRRAIQGNGRDVPGVADAVRRRSQPRGRGLLRHSRRSDPDRDIRADHTGRAVGRWPDEHSGGGPGALPGYVTAL